MGSNEKPAGSRQLATALEITIRIGTLLLLVGWCFTIVRPFLSAVLWGIIIAIASHRSFVTLQRLVGGHAGLAAGTFVLIALLVLALPAMLLAGTLFTSLKDLAQHFADGTLRIPTPPDSVRNWFVIGDPLHRYWLLASTNLDQAVRAIAPELTGAGQWLFSMVGEVLTGFVQFILAIFIAAALLMNAQSGARVAGDVATGLAGSGGHGYAELAVHTVRSVTRGIIGVALIQATLAGLGFLAAGLPAAGLLALLCLVVAIVQLPLVVVLLPVALYAFTTLDTVPAVIFAIWCAIIGLSDNILKPLLLGRGVDVPMLVIFIGAIGGLLSSGILGLFVGPVVLALGYTLLAAWLKSAGELRVP